MRIHFGWTLLLLASLAGCSSTPSPITYREAGDRGEYIRLVDQELSRWEKDAKKKPVRQSLEMMAVIQDTRAETRSVEMAPASDWERYKRGVESRMDRIRELDAKKAE